MAMFKDKLVELNSSDTVIARDAYLKGDITVKSSIKVEGSVDGNISEAKTVTVGKSGKIKGNISCDKCSVYGEIKGNILASELVEAMSESRIEGDIKAGRVTIEEGSFFNGKCLMETSKNSKSEAAKTEAAKGGII